MCWRCIKAKSFDWFYILVVLLIRKVFKILKKTHCGFSGFSDIGWFWWKKPRVVLVKKAQARIWKKFFLQLSNLSKQVFLLENPIPLGLGNWCVPNFCETNLDIFAICSLVPSTNLSYAHQSYLAMPKKSKLFTREGWFKVFP